jgi:hypothetical protein
MTPCICSTLGFCNARVITKFENFPNGGFGVSPDPPSVEFAGYSRRWVHSRTNVLQVPTNKEDPVKSADPEGLLFSRRMPQ